jgi:hypothetical protein
LQEYVQQRVYGGGFSSAAIFFPSGIMFLAAEMKKRYL